MALIDQSSQSNFIYFCQLTLILLASMHAQTNFSTQFAQGVKLPVFHSPIRIRCEWITFNFRETESAWKNLDNKQVWGNSGGISFFSLQRSNTRWSDKRNISFPIAGKICNLFQIINSFASWENWTLDPWFTRPVLCLWAKKAVLAAMQNNQ